MIIQIVQRTGDMLTCARFKRNGRMLTPVSGYRRSFQDDAEFTRILQENPLPPGEETRIILALAPAQVSLREMSLPLQDRKKLRAILPLELAGEIAEDAAELVCDVLPLSDGSLLAGWASVQSIAPVIRLMAEAGQEPEVVTCSSLAWHLVQPPQQQGVIALVDATAIMVCGQGKPVFCRGMETDATALSRTLAAVELGKGVTVETVYRLEGDPLPGEQLLLLPEQLAGQQGSGDLPANVLISPLATAMAYCSGEIFNLRTGPLAWSGKRSHLVRQFRTPLILGAVVLLLLFAETSLRWHLLARDITATNRSIATIYRTVFPTRTKAVDEVAELKAEIRRLQQGGSGNATLAFLTLVAQSKDEKIIGFSEVELDTERFQLKGDTLDATAVTALSRKVSEAGWTVEQPALTNRPGATTLFVLKGKRGSTQP
ncbi:MAG: type II secretion system protein GspL [Trichlorobacter sp.]|jgi:general secretion pathway protein L